MTKNNGKPVGNSSSSARPDDWEDDLECNDDDDDDVVKKGDRRKVDGQAAKSSKAKQSARDKGGSRPETSHEKRERRLREKREREAIETEMRDRERDFEKKRHGSITRYKPRKPPAGYKDPHEVCRQPVPVKVKEDKKRQMKALMNCIAFSPADPTPARTQERGRSVPRAEEMDNSLSSDTTSDMTDVTPRSSSSGCSSMSKHSVSPEQDSGVTQGRSATIAKRSRSEGRGPRRTEDRKHETDYNGNVHSTEAELEMEEMRYLQEAFEDFDLDEETSDFATSIISVSQSREKPNKTQSSTKVIEPAYDVKIDKKPESRPRASNFANNNKDAGMFGSPVPGRRTPMPESRPRANNFPNNNKDAGMFGSPVPGRRTPTPGLSAERRAKCGRKNMSFTNEQLREIERVNLILLKKIMAQKNPRSTGPPPPPQHRKTSSAINRARAEKSIDKENMSKQAVRFKWANWHMLKDHRRRQTVKEYASQRLRINSLRKNDILPQELREVADVEIAELPRNSSTTRIIPRCCLTSRPRGVIHRFRVSRIVFRHLADYNKLSGVQRAMW